MIIIQLSLLYAVGCWNNYCVQWFFFLFSKFVRGVPILIQNCLPPIDIRLQLNDHIRCLDSRVEAQVSLVSELQDYFRRRAEVEMEYSRSLDKLTKSLQFRHKEQKHK